jgi:hypothetical protein
LPAGGGTVDLGGGVKVTVAAGAVSRDSTISSVAATAAEVSTTTIASVGVASLVQPVGSAVKITLDGQLNGTATLTMPVDRSQAGDGSTLRLASFVDGAWIPVPSRYDAQTSTVSADVTHFSIWSVVGWIADKALSILIGADRAIYGPITDSPNQPDCATTAQYTVSDSVLNDAVRSCVEDAGNGTATVKVINARSYPIDIAVPDGSTFSVDDPGGAFQRLGAVITALSSGRPNLHLVPPKGEATITLPLAAGANATLTTAADMEAYLMSDLEVALDVAIQVFGAGKGADAEKLAKFGDLLAASQCFHDAVTKLGDITAPVDTQALSTITEVTFGCAGSIFKDAGLFVVADFLAIIAGLGNALIQAIEGLYDQATGGATHTLAVQRATPAKPSCTRYTVSTEEQATSCLLAAVSRRDRDAATEVAEQQAVDFLFASPPGSDAKVQCFPHNDVCEVRTGARCITLDISHGRMDVVFLEIYDAKDGCIIGEGVEGG